MKSSKLTAKYQATIPKEIRDSFKVKAGDTIVFQVLDNGIIIIRKARSFDKEYLKALNKTLNEWGSAYDEEDYKHLQNL